MTMLEVERVRPLLESEIERLIDLLDTLDDDPDLESTGDEEPWLGAPEGFLNIPNWRGLYSQGNDDREDDGDDREEVCEDEGAQCDDEGAIDCDREPQGDEEEDNRGLPAYLIGPWRPPTT